jgi:hypothetical protein
VDIRIGCRPTRFPISKSTNPLQEFIKMIDHHILGDIHGGKTIISKQTGIANPAGSGAGNSVTVSVSFTDRYGNGKLPASNYVATAVPSQACWVTITAKGSSGFNVTLTPPSGVTLASGTFDVVVLS